jgi:hypothetical protein
MLGLSQFCAVLLIALTVSPVTAPFAACDLSAIVGDGHTTTDSKILKESTTVAAFAESSLAFEHAVMMAAVVVASVRNTRQNAPPILRL